MKSLSRVVWSEGMHLGPHHFQAQSRYFEDSIQFAISAMFPNAWGLVSCELNSPALRNGTFSVVHCRGVFPDGLAFNMPESDELPQPRQIGELFPPTRDSLTISLGIPARTADRQNTALDGPRQNGFRYTAEAFSCPDETTGRDEKEVRVGRKNIQFLLDAEDSSNYTTLPIARIMRAGSGQFIFDPAFIPPVVCITASERLVLMLRRLIEMMEAKTSVPINRSASSQAFSTREIASYWFRHAVNVSLLPLRHFCFVSHGHPEELFLELSRLAGALCTFALESHPRSLPLYDHAHLDQCFAALDETIRMHLDVIVPANCISVPLRRESEFFWVGEIKDPRALERADWILALHASGSDAEIIERTPRLVKLCSHEFISKLVERALPGMTLAHLATPPPAVSPTVETKYFGVTKAGPCWEHIKQTKSVGLYLPADIPTAEPELIVVLNSE